MTAADVMFNLNIRFAPNFQPDEDKVQPPQETAVITHVEYMALLDMFNDMREARAFLQRVENEH